MSKSHGFASSKECGGLLDQSEKQRGKVKEREFAGAGGSSADVADSVSLSERSAHRSQERERVAGRKDENISQRNKVGRNPTDGSQDVADTISQRRCGGYTEGQYAEDAGQSPGHSWHNPGGVAAWLPEPDVGRVAHGVPNRVAKLRGLGNAIVPQVAAEIIRCIGLVHDVALSTTNKPKEK